MSNAFVGDPVAWPAYCLRATRWRLIVAEEVLLLWHDSDEPAPAKPLQLLGVQRKPQQHCFPAGVHSVELCPFTGGSSPEGEDRALPRGEHWPRDRAPPGREPRVSALTGDDRCRKKPNGSSRPPPSVARCSAGQCQALRVAAEEAASIDSALRAVQLRSARPGRENAIPAEQENVGLWILLIRSPLLLRGRVRGEQPGLVLSPHPMHLRCIRLRRKCRPTP
jgi:hypothetical protein